MPLRKDKTLVEILNRLTSLEGKVDGLSAVPGAPHSFESLRSSQSPLNSEDDGNVLLLISQQLAEQQRHASTGKSQPYPHSSGSLKMLLWPAIQEFITKSLPPNVVDFGDLEQDGSVFLVRLWKNEQRLPLDDDILHANPVISRQSQVPRNPGGTRISFPTLTREAMYRLATSYFDTFNFLYPLLDRESFFSEILLTVQSDGFNADADSVIALLVFALGQMAHEGSQGQPIETYDGRSSGIRGGTAIKPPGLGLFNEARKRMGFVLTECDLENVQIFSLAAYVTPLNLLGYSLTLIRTSRLYYDCSFRHAVSEP